VDLETWNQHILKIHSKAVEQIHHSKRLQCLKALFQEHEMFHTKIKEVNSDHSLCLETMSLITRVKLVQPWSRPY